MKLSIKLPEKLDMTHRSRNFWEDKYEFDDEGFTDEHGVYRAFDCYDDGARAPTPLPPIYLMKCVKEDEEQVMSAKPMATEASLSAQSTPSIRASGKSPSEATKGTVAPNRSSSSSTLSDCPSDLSDWEVSNKTKNRTTQVEEDKEETKVEEMEKPKTKQAPKRNTNTRGVAQKVNKKAKKASAAPVVLQRQTGGGTSRRSAR